MKHILFLSLLLPAVAAAQSSSGYVFGAPGALAGYGNSVSTIHIGAGVDALLAGGLGFAAELGALGPTRAIDESIGAFSPGLSYHFGRGSRTRVDPFLTGGYTLLFRGGHANAGHFGGGLNYWFSRHVGVRLEFRDIVSSQGSLVHYLGFRTGLAIR